MEAAVLHPHDAISVYGPAFTAFGRIVPYQPWTLAIAKKMHIALLPIVGPPFSCPQPAHLSLACNVVPLSMAAVKPTAFVPLDQYSPAYFWKQV
jgi:hypothetical protein